MSVQKCIPSEFARIPREVQHLYLCPVICKKFLSKASYQNIMLLHVAMRILLQNYFCQSDSDYSDKLLRLFFFYFFIFFRCHWPWLVATGYSLRATFVGALTQCFVYLFTVYVLHEICSKDLGGGKNYWKRNFFFYSFDDFCGCDEIYGFFSNCFLVVFRDEGFDAGYSWYVEGELAYLHIVFQLSPRFGVVRAVEQYVC